VGDRTPGRSMFDPSQPWEGPRRVSAQTRESGFRAPEELAKHPTCGGSTRPVDLLSSSANLQNTVQSCLIMADRCIRRSKREE